MFTPITCTVPNYWGGITPPKNSVIRQSSGIYNNINSGDNGLFRKGALN
jgi:hypothetical protein